MPQKTSLSPENQAFLSKIQKEYPFFSIKPGKKFLFRPQKTILYEEKNTNFQLLLLHELSHALLNHFTYKTSIERLQIERDAWEKTKILCEKYSIPFDENFIQDELDTYRNWLHQKTICKKCGLTCIETDNHSLFCPKCQKHFQI
ncbi:hypothetical protein IKF81_00095 [Candidatus Saccharibacteria bacterium]|nr:hypothetical protein [Candidatus Saccharibacteria bacterium]